MPNEQHKLTFLNPLRNEEQYETRTEDCPFKEMECLSFREKAERIGGWNPSRKETVWEQHVECHNEF
jgi:hypothetical protein